MPNCYKCLKSFAPFCPLKVQKFSAFYLPYLPEMCYKFGQGQQGQLPVFLSKHSKFFNHGTKNIFRESFRF